MPEGEIRSKGPTVNQMVINSASINPVIFGKKIAGIEIQNRPCCKTGAMVGKFMEKAAKTSRKKLLVSALILVNSKGEILLAQRPKGKTMAGLWEFPGGKVHENEGLEEALIREIKEEIGILLAKSALTHVYTISHAYPDFHLEMPMFLARTWQGEAAGLEDQDLAWIYPEYLSDYPMPPADLPLIDKIPEILEKF